MDGRSHDALKAQLAQPRDPPAKVIYVSTFLNELVDKCNKNKGKGREKMMETVATAQNVIINESATANPEVLHMICSPMLRLEPDWLEEKLDLCRFYIQQVVKKNSPKNVTSVSEIVLEKEDIHPDRVHLVASGTQKYADRLVEDLIKAMALLPAEGMEVEEMTTNPFGLVTPKMPKAARFGETSKDSTRKRKGKDTEDEDEGSEKRLKGATNAEILEFLKDMRAEGAAARKEDKRVVTGLVQQVEAIEMEQNDIQNEIKEIKANIEDGAGGGSKQNNEIFATILENQDGVENENLKNIVIVRKLIIKEAIPKDKPSLQKLVLETAKEIAAVCGLKPDSIAYASVLFTGKDVREEKVKGQLPAFRIIFKSARYGTKFKDEAIRKSKETGSQLHKCYIATQQTMATRIRTMLMWGIADKNRSKERGVDCWVNQSLNKPTLQFKGPAKYNKSHTFVDAMKKYSKDINPAVLTEATKLAMKSFPDQVEKYFIVIKDQVLD